MTTFTCVVKAEVKVDPLDVVADSVCVFIGRQTLLISIISFTYMLLGAVLKYL